MNSAVLPVIVEAAIRALAAALVVWAALRLLRVHNVPAQKAAWSLVLVAALAMPFAMRWDWIPAIGTIHLPAIAWGQPKALPAQLSPAAASAAQPADMSQMPATAAEQSAALLIAELERESSAANSTNLPPPAGANPSASPSTSNPETTPQALPAAQQTWSPSLLDLAWGLYLAVAAALLLRLLAGLAVALRLWFTAQRIDPNHLQNIAPGAEVRWSRRVSSPVNIASCVVLPADFRTWSAEKLRVVLAHERSHVRQGDFYLQLLAGFYAALFWFSPLGWWLKRKLSDLGEAIGDRAGLEAARSRQSYAHMLLEFAALPRPTLTGVAMAREGKLTSRIERLLNDSIFSQAFAAGRRRALIALLIAPAVLFTSAALVRVQAAGQNLPQPDQPQLAAPAPAAPAPAETGVSHPPNQIITDQAPPPAAAPAPAAAPNAVPAPAPASPAAPAPAAAPNALPAPAPAPQAAPAPPAAPGAPQTIVTPSIPPMNIQVPGNPPTHVVVPPIPPVHVQVPSTPELNAEIGALMKEMPGPIIMDRYPYYFDSNGGDAWALVTGPGQPQMHIPHSQQSLAYNGARKQIDAARKMAHGPFLWFHHNGKSYFIDDPSVVAQVQAMQKPMENVRTQMRALGEQMRALGQKMREQAHQRKQVEVPKPDLSKTMAELNAAVDKLKSSQGNTISQQQLMQLQQKMAELQRRLASLQRSFYVPNEQWSASMGKLGGQMGKLGAEQGRLGGEMARLAAENRGKIASIISQSLKNGKAKEVK